MNKRFRTKAKFENGFLKPQNPIELSSGEEVDLIIIKHDDLLEEKGNIDETSLLELASKNPGFSFLENKEEDIYSVKDLKKRYKR